MTAKEKVLKVHRGVCPAWMTYSQEYVIWDTDDPSEKVIGRGKNIQAAWQNAAESLPAQPESGELPDE